MICIDVVCLSEIDFTHLVNTIVKASRPLDIYRVIVPFSFKTQGLWRPYNISVIEYRLECRNLLMNKAIRDLHGNYLVVLDSTVSKDDLQSLIGTRLWRDFDRSGTLGVRVGRAVLNRVGGVRTSLGKDAFADWISRIEGNVDPGLEDISIKSVFFKSSGEYSIPNIVPKTAYWGLGLSEVLASGPLKRQIAQQFWNWCKSKSPSLKITLVPEDSPDFCCCYPDDEYLKRENQCTVFWPWTETPPSNLATRVSAYTVDWMSVKYPILFANFPYRTRLAEPSFECLYSRPIDEKAKIITHLHCYDLADFETIYGTYMPLILNISFIVVSFSNSGRYIRKLIDLGVGSILWVENRGFDLGGKFAFTWFCRSLKAESVSHYLFLHSKTCSRTRKRWFNKLLLNWTPLSANESRFGGYLWEYSSDGYRYSGQAKTRDVCYKGFLEACEYYGAKPPYRFMQDGNCFVIPVSVAEILYCDLAIYSLLNTEQSYDHMWFTRKIGNSGGRCSGAYCAHIGSGSIGNVLASPSEMDRDGQIEHVLERVVYSLCAN